MLGLTGKNWCLFLSRVTSIYETTMFMNLFLSLMQYLALKPGGLISSYCNQIIQDFSKRKLQRIPVLRSQGQKPI